MSGIMTFAAAATQPGPAGTIQVSGVRITDATDQAVEHFLDLKAFAESGVDEFLVQEARVAERVQPILRLCGVCNRIKESVAQGGEQPGIVHLFLCRGILYRVSALAQQANPPDVLQARRQVVAASL